MKFTIKSEMLNATVEAKSLKEVINRVKAKYDKKLPFDNSVSYDEANEQFAEISYYDLVNDVTTSFVISTSI